MPKIEGCLCNKCDKLAATFEPNEVGKWSKSSKFQLNMGILKDWSFIIMCCDCTMLEDSFVSTVWFVEAANRHPSNSLELLERLV